MAGVKLTPRQFEILELIASGHTDKEISGQLGISENTVNTHLRLAFAVLGVHNRSGAVGKMLNPNENREILGLAEKGE
jgi:DNA-binding CsgD family transcriptional regulator